MTYTILLNQDGAPSGYIADEAGKHTEQQAKDAILCGKINPTDAEISAAISFASAFQAKTAYKRDRALEYPPITDYLDGVVKGDQAQIDAYIAACQAVKSKYPKPDA